MLDQGGALRNIHTFPQLIKFLRDELGWPIESDKFEDLTFDYTAEELGIDTASAAKIQEIKRLRPLSANQPWGIFFVKFEPKRLPVVALRRMLSRVVLKKRASANSSDRAVWQADDLLFVSNYGEGTERHISFAHFSQDAEKADLPTLKVLGWDNRDTVLHMDDVATLLHQRLAWPADERDAKRWREVWRSAFILRHREVITTSKDLAVRLAELARAIRDRIQTVLAIETEKGPLTKLMRAFQQALIHDLRADDFADMYAQTIAYGLLSARVANPAHNTADSFATHIPVTNPFLKELMETFLHVGGRKRKVRDSDGIDFDELGVSEIVELLDAANMEAVVRDFGDRNPDEDPVIHFYELFLKEYDAKKRMQRGVFYTPQPVVSYIVRSVHELLKSEFGLEDGLADTTTWNEMLTRHKGLRPPPGLSLSEPFVQILDPATGTATFLVEVIDVIHRTLTQKWSRQRLTGVQPQVAWNEYVAKHLLPRLHGYELLMAPYAIAHMKIGLKLHETGYRFGTNERARIYLTNALDPANDEKEQRQFEAWVPALAHEAKAVNEIKRNKRFTVIIGNPPYSGHSANTGEWITRLVDDYYVVDGQPLAERNPKWLQDDYVKFTRLGEYCITQTGAGIQSYITNHGYIDNPTFRGMRQHLMQSFQAINVLDLHGNTIKKERCPDGSEDQNVFDIKQGVAIVAARRVERSLTDGTSISHEDLFGRREYKYSELLVSTFVGRRVKNVQPASPFYLFFPQDLGLREEYGNYLPITDVMPVNVLGFQTHRDHFAIDFDRETLLRRIAEFRGSISDDRAAELFGLKDNRDWKLHDARKQLRHDKTWMDSLIQCAYRPFDSRPCYFSSAAMDYPRREMLDHVANKENLCLGLGRQGIAVQDPVWSLVAISKHPMDANIFRRGGVNVFPLWLYPEEGLLSLEKQRRPNFSPDFGSKLARALGTEALSTEGLPFGLAPEQIIHYAFGIFHSLAYRTRYADFLKIDFPRLPLPGDVNLFRYVAALGGQLIGLHLLESHECDDRISTYSGPATPEIDKISYSLETVWLDKAQTRGFHGVSQQVWDFHIGGYQVCEKWLKDRLGRTLSEHEVAQYQRIVFALGKTIELIGEIDKVIEAHGGWPGAFWSNKIPIAAAVI